MHCPSASSYYLYLLVFTLGITLLFTVCSNDKCGSMDEGFLSHCSHHFGSIFSSYSTVVNFVWYHLGYTDDFVYVCQHLLIELSEKNSHALLLTYVRICVRCFY